MSQISPEQEETIEDRVSLENKPSNIVIILSENLVDGMLQSGIVFRVVD